MVIEEEWFDDMSLTDDATFLTSLIKRAETRVNQKIIFLRDTKRCIQEIAINNGCNTHFFRVLREILDRNFLFKGNLLSRLPKSVELSHKCIKNIFKYQEPEFYSKLFDESEKGPFEVPPGRTKTRDFKNWYLMLQSCMFCGETIALVCYVYCLLHYYSLVIKLLLIIL